MVGRDRILPGRPLGGLCVRPLADPLRAHPRRGRHSCGADDCCMPGAAGLHRHGLEQTAPRTGSAMAHHLMPRFDRVALLRACGQRPAAAGLVRTFRSSGGGQSLFSLCRQQSRQRAGAPVVSCADRAVRAAGPADTLLGRFLLSLARAHRGLRRRDAVARAPHTSPCKGEVLRSPLHRRVHMRQPFHPPGATKHGGRRSPRFPPAC
jgi:hypothetical protein